MVHLAFFVGAAMGIVSHLLAGVFSRENMTDGASEARSDSIMGSLMAHRGAGSVTPSSAMQIATVFSCVRVLAESLASIPLILYERERRNKKRAVNHPMYSLLHDLPNPEMTSFEVRTLLMGHAVTWGNGYAQKVLNGRGQVAEIWPLRPDKMSVSRGLNGDLLYTYQHESDGTIRFSRDRILHLRGLGFDGVQGYSPIRLMSRGMALANNMEEYGNKFYENGARPSIALIHPQKLSQDAYNRLRDTWEARHMGAENAHRMALLEGGLDIKTFGIPPQDAQFLQTQKYQRSQIAGIFRVPLHMINDLERATFSNIEHLSLEFVTFTLQPWLVMWEQAIFRDLIPPNERGRYFAEFLVDGLLRGDTESRYRAYNSAITTGWMMPNEAREKENLNPLDGGDVLLRPLNMAPTAPNGKEKKAAGDFSWRHADWCSCEACQAVDNSEQRNEDDAEDDEAEKLRTDKVKLAVAMQPLFEDVARRVVRREVADLRRAVDKHLRKRSTQDFLSWLTEFYSSFPQVIREAFAALMTSYAEQVMTNSASEVGKDDLGLTDEMRQFVESYLETMANEHVAVSRRQIEALIDDAQSDGADAADYIEERLNGWEERRPATIGQRQSFEAGNALAVAAYGALGVQFLRWLASGDSCDFCQNLNGRVIGIAGYFVMGGTHLDGGQSGLMLVRRNTRHGPIHSGCDCMVMAA